MRQEDKRLGHLLKGQQVGAGGEEDLPEMSGNVCGKSEEWREEITQFNRS